MENYIEMGDLEMENYCQMQLLRYYVDSSMVKFCSILYDLFSSTDAEKVHVQKEIDLKNLDVHKQTKLLKEMNFIYDYFIYKDQYYLLHSSLPTYRTALQKLVYDEKIRKRIFEMYERMITEILETFNMKIDFSGETVSVNKTDSFNKETAFGDLCKKTIYEQYL